MNKRAIDSQPGKRLLEIRQHRGISQGRIAKVLGVSVGTVQNYEHGRTHITTDRLEQLARALQCEPADLLKPPGSPLPRYVRSRRLLDRIGGQDHPLRAARDPAEDVAMALAALDGMRA